MSDPSIQLQNISILPKADCFGCGVCVDVCPTRCIVMADDQEGFPYPAVDHDACIECDKCISSCPGLNEISRQHFLPQPAYYGGFCLDDLTRHNSSSGGFFSLVADHILAQGGVAYGARYDFDQMTVVHARVDQQSALEPLRKSKYVQSSTANIFPQVSQDLQAGKHVLFTGTPCQVAGLHLFLREVHPNLVTCDIICHGVPSPGLFQRHFLAMARNKGKQITQIDFRTKEKGWAGPLQLYLQVEFGSESTLTYALLDAYYALFSAKLSLRPCCYACKYANTQRNADLTLGDFWGVKRQYPGLFDGKGTSLLLANTEQGQQLLQTISPLAQLQHIPKVTPLPLNLVHPTPRPKYRQRFFKQVNLAEWHPRRRWFHLRAMAIIAWDKTMGLIRKIIGRSR